MVNTAQAPVTDQDISNESAELRGLYSPPNRNFDLTPFVTLRSTFPVVGTGVSDIYHGDWRPDPAKDSILVAVKLSRAANLPSTPEVKLQHLKWLHQEISVWNCLKPHPNIQPLLGLYWHDTLKFPATVSTWEDNRNLMLYVDKLDPDSDTYARKMTLLSGVLDGLVHLHDNEVTHADLKAENVLVTKDGTPRLCDFGFSYTSIKLSVVFSLRLTTKGTDGFMAPELINLSGDIDPAVLRSKPIDVWAFGCLTCQVFTKKTPVFDAAAQSLQFPDALDARLSPFVAFCCVANPKERPENARAIQPKFEKLGV